MVALAQSRKIIRRDGDYFVYPVAAQVTILSTALVILAAGVARPGREGQGADTAAKAANALTYRAVGIAQLTVVGGGADGDVKIEVRAGTFNFKNSSAGDAITLADVGAYAYLVDDQTVAKTSATATRCTAGKIVDVDADGVWVRVGPTV